ncbi:MAG: AIR carboxylase family protein [Alphaproteobacteria bacterium]
MKILAVFGSASDETTAAPLCAALKGDFEVEYQVISAHRDLEKLQHKMAEWKGDAVIAGAGLAAALPGVVAAMVKIPVFGVPVAAQFGGLDSLASIAQMPPGVPVMTCGPGRGDAIVSFLKAYKTSPLHYGRVHFVMRDKNLLTHPELLAEIEKAKAAGKAPDVDVTLSDIESRDAFNVFFVTGPSDVADGLRLHVPFMPKAEAQKPENYLPVFEWAKKGGLWLGVNNTRNAVASVARLAGAARVLQGRAA